MAGLGKRLRPHTLTTPKPLIKLAGKSIVERLFEKLLSSLDKKVDNVGFVVGDFGDEFKLELYRFEEKFDTKVKFYKQDQPLGTAHAIYCAQELLEGEVIIAFADTLFDANFSFKNVSADSVIFTKKVENPSSYGVVVLDGDKIGDFVEKPKEKISDLAIIGIYYFKNGEVLFDKIQFLLSNQIKGNGEYQLTDALKLMLEEGYYFTTAVVDGWYDCGNKDVLLQTLEYVLKTQGQTVYSSNVENTILGESVYIGPNAVVKNSVLKNNVSIENDAIIEDSILENVIVFENASVKGVNLKNAIIGSNSIIYALPKDIDLGAFSKLKL